ncbi:MAG: phosphonopyruvate decarboxylase [Kiloniellales bacterium]
MIGADDFLGPARRRGLDFYVGVPCSFLTPIINRVIDDPRLDYVAAASEGEAVAIAAGAWLAGRETAVMCQNSGLGNAVNPLTSLNFPFRVPTLLIVTWRGQPGLKDEPQHELMGQVTGDLLGLIEVARAGFPSRAEAVAEALDVARRHMAETGLPYAFIMQKDTVRDHGLDPPSRSPLRRAKEGQPPAPAPPPGTFVDHRAGEARPTRLAALERFLEMVPDRAAVIATTGKCGRELFTLADRRQHLYQVGSMGCAGAMGLGLAMNAGRPVVVLDGDGAALMKMGAMATIGAYAPGTLIHLILDNGVHDSTGGQATVSASVDFARVALACGYARAASCDDLDGFERAFRASLAAPGPWLIHLRIEPGSLSGLGRPTLSPAEVARRFKDFVASG